MTVGFFYLKGHGVPRSLLARMFAEAKRFHSLPEAEKGKIPYFAVGGLDASSAKAIHCPVSMSQSAAEFLRRLAAFNR